MLSRPVRLLVIDENRAFHRLIHEAFRHPSLKANCVLTFVEDGEKALALLLETEAPFEPDLILLDWNLPKINGDAVLHRLKADAKLKVIPVLVFSSSSARSDIQAAYHNHANGFITKPLEPDVLYRTVNAIVEFWTRVVELPPLIAGPDSLNP